MQILVATAGLEPTLTVGYEPQGPPLEVASETWKRPGVTLPVPSQGMNLESSYSKPQLKFGVEDKVKLAFSWSNPGVLCINYLYIVLEVGLRIELSRMGLQSIA